MKKIIFVVLTSIAILFSCVEPVDECATCYSIKENTSTGSIEDKVSEGTKCGNELDSLESIEPVYLDEYKLYYSCE